MSYLDDLVRRHGVPYRFASLLEERRSYLIDGVIVLNEDLTPESAHWAY